MRTRINTLVTILLLLSLAAASRADVVTGRVLDAQEKPVAGADILIRFKPVDSNKWQYQETTSNALGAFVADVSGKIDFSSEANRSIIYAVAPGKAYSVALLQPKDNVLHLDTAESVSGRILDVNNKPIVHASINLGFVSGSNQPLIVDLPEEKPWATRFQTFTDKGGYWKLKAVPKGGTASLEVSDPRFIPDTFRVQQGKTPLTLYMRPGAIIRGRVVDEQGKPLGNVEVQRSRHYKTRTATDGTFRLTGLTPKKYIISARTKDYPLVAQSVEVKINKTAEHKEMPDIVMTSGSVISGRVTNQQTGEPIPKVSIISGEPENFNIDMPMRSTRTDADGNYHLRVPSGKRTVNAYYYGKRYFQQFTERNIELKEAQAVTENFTIQSGETLSGVALDKDGKAIKDVSVIVDTIKEKEDIGTFLPKKSVTDANGKWSISGIAPQKVQVRIDDPWATDKLITFKLPHPTEVQLHLIPQNDLPPIGRLIDTNGKPIANVKVNLQYKMPHSTPFDIKTNTNLTSDKSGYLHFRMPLVAKYPTISDVDVTGYQWTTGGDWDDKTQRFSDVKLDPLSRKIQGRVLDANGKPVAKAQVVAVGLGRAETETKQDGSFIFENLPDRQQLTLLAIGEAGVAKLLQNISQTSATLHLSPLQQTFPSKAQSLDALGNLYNSSTEDTEQNFIIDDMARYDAPRALKMIQGKQKKFPAAQILQTLNLIAANNPQVALQWGGAHLAQVAAKDRIAVLCQLVKLAATQNKALAQKYFSQAVALVKGIPEPKVKKYKDKDSTELQTLLFLQSRILLAGAAAKAQPAQTGKWVDEILQLSKDKRDQGVDWPRSDLVSALAVSAPQEAARAILDSDANTKFMAYDNAVKTAATVNNSALTFSWFKKLQQSAPSVDTNSLLKMRVESDLRDAAISVISVVGSNNPKQALQLARSIGNANALVLAAQFQPRETALEIWREQYDSGDILSDVRLVGLIYDVDKTEGKVLFDKLIKTYWAQLNTDTYFRRSASEIAYYLARYKPRESWLMLQTEWAQITKNSRSDASSQAALTPEEKMIPIPSSSSASDQANIALAMSSVDFSEAMKWARHIESQDKKLSLKTQRQLLEIALATPKQRRDLSVLGFYISGSYKPGDAVSW